METIKSTQADGGPWGFRVHGTDGTGGRCHVDVEALDEKDAAQHATRLGMRVRSAHRHRNLITPEARATVWCVACSGGIALLSVAVSLGAARSAREMAFVYVPALISALGCTFVSLWFSGGRIGLGLLSGIIGGVGAFFGTGYAMIVCWHVCSGNEWFLDMIPVKDRLCTDIAIMHRDTAVLLGVSTVLPAVAVWVRSLRLLQKWEGLPPDRQRKAIQRGLLALGAVVLILALFLLVPEIVIRIKHPNL